MTRRTFTRIKAKKKHVVVSIQRRTQRIYTKFLALDIYTYNTKLTNLSSTKIIKKAKIFWHVPILILAGSVYENVPDTPEKYLLPPRIIYVLYDF